MRTFSRLAVGLLVGGMVCGRPAAQAAEGRSPVDLKVTLRADYTDNRDSIERDTPTLKKESNVDFYVIPRVDLYLDTARTLYDFHYAPAWRYRTDPSPIQNDNELLHDLGLRIDHHATDRTRLRVVEQLLYQDDPSVEDGGTGLVRGNRTYLQNRVELGLRHEFSRQLAADAMAAYRIKAYKDSEVADESDEDQLDAMFGLWRTVNPKLILHGRGGVAMYGFDSAIGLDRDFDVFIAAAGAEKIFSQLLRAGFEAGVQAVEYSDAGLDSEVFPYGRVDATVTPTPDNRITAMVTHGVRDSDVYPFASQTYTEVRGGIEVDPSALITAGLSLTLRLSEYDGDSRPASAAAIAGPTTGDETTLVVSGHAVWNINDQTRLRVRQTYEDVDSDFPNGSFTKNTSSLELIREL